jgi:threonine dehydratase
MWPLLREHVDDSIVVSLDDVASAMAIVAERARVIAEGAALSPAIASKGHRKVVAIVSGGNIDLARFATLVNARS